MADGGDGAKVVAVWAGDVDTLQREAWDRGFRACRAAVLDAITGCDRATLQRVQAAIDEAWA